MAKEVPGWSGSSVPQTLGELEGSLARCIASSRQMLHRDDYYQEASRHEIPGMSVVMKEPHPLMVNAQCHAAVLYAAKIHYWLEHHGMSGQPERVAEFSNWNEADVYLSRMLAFVRNECNRQVNSTHTAGDKLSDGQPDSAKPSGDPAPLLAKIGLGQMMCWPLIADLYEITGKKDRDRLRQKLEYWRTRPQNMDSPDWTENENRRSKDPKYLFRLSIAEPFARSIVSSRKIMTSFFMRFPCCFFSSESPAATSSLIFVAIWPHETQRATSSHLPGNASCYGAGSES